MTELARATTRQVAVLTAPTKAELEKALKRRMLAGQVESAWDLHLITSGPHAGSYGVRITRLPGRPVPQDPRWAVLCRNVGLGLLGISALVAALAWLLTAMTAAALVTVCGSVLGAFLGWLYLKYGRRGNSSVEVNVSVHTR